MIAAINPSKTLQKPLEAILKPSKGFSLSVAHQRARTQSRGSTLTACGRATLDGVKRHPHPRGCSSLELLPLAPPRIGNGAKPRIWVKGRVPCGVQGRSPLPCRAQVISNPLRYGVTCYTTFVNQAAVIAFSLILPGCSWTAIQALAARWLPPLICDQLTLPKAAPLDSPTS